VGETAARFSLARIAGNDCFGSAPFGGFSPRVLGFGVYGDATQGSLDRIRRHYARLGQTARIVVCEGAGQAGTLALLRRNGLKPEEWRGAGWVLEVRDEARVRRRAARVLRDPALDVGPAFHELGLWGRLSREGFGQRGRWRIFARTSVRMFAAQPRTTVPFIARRRERPGGSAAMLLHRGGGLLFSGSVIPSHRGRGLQPALLAARLLHGLDRGVTAFFSQSSLQGSSADNLREAGFRRLWTYTFWELP